MKRIFAAIKIHPSELFQNTYYQLQSYLKDEKIKWVDLRSIHITLKFFGETEERRLEGIASLLRDISSDHHSFNLKINNVGMFGSSYKPRVLWFGVEKNKHLICLGSDIQDQVQKTGFETDRQNFVPHLTIGRIKHLQDKNRFQEVIKRYKNLAIQELVVDQFHLIESTLKPAGPEYIVLESFRLGI